MAQYVDPGLAAQDAIEGFLTRQHARELEDQREQRLQRSEELELQRRREELEARRLDREETRRSREEDRKGREEDRRFKQVQARIADLAPGDYPEAKLIRDANEVGIPLRLGPAKTEMVPQGQAQVSLPGQVVDPMTGQGPTGSPTPVQMPGAQPPMALPLGRPYLGTAKQQAEVDQRQRVQGIMDRMANSAPGSPEWSRAAIEYEMTTGRSLPAGVFKSGTTDTEPVFWQDPRTHRVQRLMPDGSWQDWKGDVPKGAHFMTQPQPPAPVIIQGEEGSYRAPRFGGPATPITDTRGHQIRGPRASQVDKLTPEQRKVFEDVRKRKIAEATNFLPSIFGSGVDEATEDSIDAEAYAQALKVGKVPGGETAPGGTSSALDKLRARKVTQ